MSNIKVELAVGAEEELGTSDEIKEFKHEGELESHKDALLDIKNALAMTADKPPLAAALDYILQLKSTAGIPPIVIEVANRIKQELISELLKSSSMQGEVNATNSLPTVNLVYGIPNTPKLTEFPTICLPSHIPNVNAASLSGSYVRPNWATPMLITSSQSTSLTRPPTHQLPYYYNQSATNLHYSPHNFGSSPGSQLLSPTPQQQQQQAPPAKGKGSKSGAKKKCGHIKKPLNAFMLYMKEMRAKVVQEYTLKESAAINQILGKRWHALDRSEQARFYEMARRERALHMQMYPNWSARSNYATTGKKKRKRDKTADQEAGSPKKCRARYGLDKQSSWCKPCRRKKKCVRYLQGGEDTDCKDGKCDADGEHHKPSCPAAHEPGCSVRGADSCDCNTHTCGGEFRKSEKDEKDSCTCRKEDKGEKTGGGGVGMSSGVASGTVASSGVATGMNVGKEEKQDTLHLASVANLSLTPRDQTNITSVASSANIPRIENNPVRFKTENVFTSAQFRSDFEQQNAAAVAAAVGQQRVGFMSQGMEYSNTPVVVSSTGMATLSHFPNN